MGEFSLFPPKFEKLLLLFSMSYKDEFLANLDYGIGSYDNNGCYY